MTASGRSPPRISDPRIVPVTGTDAHLPALAPDLLSEDAVRRRFAAPGVFVPELAGDGRLLAQREPVPAAVLVPLVRRPDGLQVLLTQRTAHLRDHAGQISFPGGRCEAHDADAPATALREAEEEVGLGRRHVEVVGQMPHYTTVTGFVVTPVIALVDPGFAVAPDAFEVEEVFEVPLSFLMTPAHHRRHALEWEGVKRQFLSMPWPGFDAEGRPREYFIWGATASMLRNLYRFLAGGARP